MRIRKFNILTSVVVVGLPALLVYFLWMTSVNKVTFIQVGLAFALALIPWQGYLSWRRGGREEFPMFAVIAAMYFLYYAVALFWGDWFIISDMTPEFEVPADALTEALIMATLGLCLLGLGMKTRFGSRLLPSGPSRLSIKPTRMNYIRFVLVAGSLASLFDQSLYLFGSGSRQVVSILISTVPLLAFAILFRAYLRKESTTLDRILIVGFLSLRFLGGMSSGWLGAFTSILVICAALYISERRRLPRVALLLVIGFTVFFQVGKDDFRRAYWTDREPPASKMERLMFWVDASFEKWSEAIVNPSARNLRETISPSVNRLALLTQTGNVIDKTPRIVPYQNGRLYSYMLVTLIPRFLWPDKPSVNEANQYYQVAYGLTSEENLEGVSISVGVMTEGYINFGWAGALGVMFLLGIFCDFFRVACFSKNSGALWTALGMVLLPQLISIESQMAQYLGGLVQQVILTLLIMLPALKLTSKPVKLQTVRLGYVERS